MRHKLLTITIAMGIIAIALLPLTHIEAGIYEQAKEGAQTAIDEAYGGGESVSVDPHTEPFPKALANVVSSILTFVGIVFFGLLIYAGYLWMTARGKEDQIDKAKRITREVVIGLLIIVLARIITEFILTQIGEAIDG